MLKISGDVAIGARLPANRSGFYPSGHTREEICSTPCHLPKHMIQFSRIFGG